jgi:hypothetical protein
MLGLVTDAELKELVPNIGDRLLTKKQFLEQSRDTQNVCFCTFLYIVCATLHTCAESDLWYFYGTLIEYGTRNLLLIYTQYLFPVNH